MDELARTNELVHVVEHAEGQAVTHAIVIGIGTYPWGRDISATSILIDITSPPRSAAAVADWLIKEYNNPDRPLSTVSLVVSEGEAYTYRNPKTGVQYVVPSGNAEDLRRCVKEWAARSGAHSENGSVFYFCGHGISAGQRDCLLARSFGQEANDHLAGAFERASVVNAMRYLGPRHQLFLFDACRVEDNNLLDSGAAATPFLTWRPGTLPLVPVECCSLIATAPSMAAFGTAGAISRFASAFLDACATAAERKNGWWISTRNVLGHMNRFVREQACQMDGQDIRFHLLPSQPRVPVVVSCEPTSHLSSAKIEIHPTGELVASPIAFDGQAELTVDYWRVLLNPGDYRLSALQCQLPSFKPFECHGVYVYPPFIDIILDMAKGTIV